MTSKIQNFLIINKIIKIFKNKFRFNNKKIFK